VSVNNYPLCAVLPYVVYMHGNEMYGLFQYLLFLCGTPAARITHPRSLRRLNTAGPSKQKSCVRRFHMDANQHAIRTMQFLRRTLRCISIV